MSAGPRGAVRLVGLLMVCVAALVYAFVGERTTFRCSRADGACTLTQRTLLRTQRKELALADLLRVEEERTHLTFGRSRASGRTFLITRRGPVQVEAWASFGPAGVVEVVQQYLDDPREKDLVVEYDSRSRTASAVATVGIAAMVIFGVSFMLPTRTTGSR